MVVARIEEKLKNYPEVAYRSGPGYLKIPALTPTGFQVSVQESPGRFTVAFEGWHEEFTDPEAALNCFVYGLSSACRLRVFRCLGFDFKWQLLVGDQVESETALLVPTFWLPKQQRVLQNHLLPP